MHRETDRTDEHLAARRRPTSSPTTLYRLTDVTEFRSVIRAKYLDMEGFNVQECAVGDRPALLVQGHVETERAEWAGRVSELIDDEVNARNTTAAAVLLIKTADGVT